MKTIMRTICPIILLLAGVRPLQARGVSSMGQAGSMVGSSRSQSDLIQRTFTIGGTVKTLQGDPTRGARLVVRASNYMAAIRELRTDAWGDFTTELKLGLEMTEGFEVDVKAEEHG